MSRPHLAHHAPWRSSEPPAILVSRIIETNANSSYNMATKWVTGTYLGSITVNKIELKYTLALTFSRGIPAPFLVYQLFLFSTIFYLVFNVFMLPLRSLVSFETLETFSKANP